MMSEPVKVSPRQVGYSFGGLTATVMVAVGLGMRYGWDVSLLAVGGVWFVLVVVAQVVYRVKDAAR